MWSLTRMFDKDASSHHSIKWYSSKQKEERIIVNVILVYSLGGFVCLRQLQNKLVHDCCPACLKTASHHFLHWKLKILCLTSISFNGKGISSCFSLWTFSKSLCLSVCRYPLHLNHLFHLSIFAFRPCQYRLLLCHLYEVLNPFRKLLHPFASSNMSRSPQWDLI